MIVRSKRPVGRWLGAGSSRRHRPRTSRADQGQFPGGWDDSDGKIQRRCVRPHEVLRPCHSRASRAGNKGESQGLTDRVRPPLTSSATAHRIVYRDLPNWRSCMERDVLIKCVTADVEATVTGAFDLSGLRTVVDIRAAAVKELGQRIGKAVHDRGHVSPGAVVQGPVQSRASKARVSAPTGLISRL